jgi:hypothetical protein
MFGRDRRYPITNAFREDPGAPVPRSAAASAPAMERPRGDGGETS